MNRIFSRVAETCGWPALLCCLLMSLAAKSPAQERGAAIFQNSGCLRCHSITGVGGTRAPDLGKVGLRRSPVQIRKQIVHGGHGMPPFGDVLSTRKIDAIVQFLRSCRTDTPPGCRTWEAPATP